MPSDAAHQFVEMAERSGILAPAEAKEALAQLTVNGAVTTDQVVNHLVEKKILTAYQAGQLIEGKGEECVIAGRYHVLDKLGEGGMGAVYKARDTNLDRMVAVKVLPAGRLYDGDAVARFQREAKALARLSHPHIIQAFDSGDERGRHFLVMEYVEGLTLDKVLRQHGALAPTLAADLIYQSALGLQHAHEKGLIHRDLKPANLLVAGLTARPEPSAEFRETMDYPGTPSPQRLKAAAATIKILDLGLARFLQDQLGDTQLTQEGAGMGTPDYMAPEQFRDALHADARTDIYGLGCTLYHLIAGQVPFPGTSFSEKAHAHAKKEPIPLEERCPEVPAGLAFIVQKMMAKHPAERYQSAGAVAEALAPFVAGSSHSVIRMRETGRWPPGQVTMLAPRPVRRALPWAVGAIMLVISGLLLLIAWPTLFPPDSSNLDPESNAKAPDPKAGDSPNKDTPPKPQEPAKPTIVTIGNGLTVAKDGTGQFQSISDALDKVQAGQTIRVLDDAVYLENLSIGALPGHRGIIIEGPKHPIIEVALSRGGGIGIQIIGVADVTVRGLHFRCREGRINTCMIRVRGACPGLRLEELEFKSEEGMVYNGIAVYGHADLPANDRPIVIRKCTVHRPHFGITIEGVEADDSTPALCAKVIVSDNVIITPSGYGILVRGLVREVLVAGNRIRGPTSMSGIQFDMVAAGSEQVLFANNTIFGCEPALRFWDPAPRGAKIEFSNNLILGAAYNDIQFQSRRPGDWDYSPPGDGALAVKAWKFTHNWREGSNRSKPAMGWVPASASDVFKSRIEVMSIDPSDGDFLRPKEAHLASAGVGGDLPAYIGAIPPGGANQWDWQKTWASRHPKMLLTVSKNPKDKADFNNITEALANAQAGQTIRVLDEATYKETLAIGRIKNHSGITLEAVKGATLMFPKGNLGLLISDVPHVTVRGFSCRHEGELNFMIVVGGNCHGLHLDRLDLKANNPSMRAISLEAIEPGRKVGVIENCAIEGAAVGLRVSGYLNYADANPCGSLVLQNNTIRDTFQGIQLTGSVSQVHVVGNRISFAKLYAVQLENLLPGTNDILIANNTILDCKAGLRYWDDGQRKNLPKNIQIVNNLFLGSPDADMLFLDSGGSMSNVSGPGQGARLTKDWHWSCNWRETRSPKGNDIFSKSWIPIAPADTRQDKIDVLSREIGSPDFLRPSKDSPLATKGAGGDLPSYIGAMPPNGVEPWDWSKVWRERFKKKNE